MKDYGQYLENIKESMDRKEIIHYNVSGMVRLGDKAKDLVDLRLENLFGQLVEFLEERPLEKADYKKYKALIEEIKKHVKDKYGWLMKGDVTGQYMAMGVAFGLLLGAGFSAVNTAFIAIGLPIGIGLGVSLGVQKENALEDKGLLY